MYTWISVFDNTQPPADPPTPADPPPADLPPADPPPADPHNNLKLTVEQQAHVNTLIAKEKRDGQERAKKALAEAEALGTKAKLTSEERDSLASRLETMRSEMMTAEEQAKASLRKSESKHETDLKASKAEADAWRTRYTDSTIEGAIISACSHEETAAYEPSQVIAILKANTQLHEELNDKSEPTGRLVPKVKFEDTDSDGKRVELLITVDEAVKKMSESKSHANLFKSNAVGGAGMFRQHGGSDGNVSAREAAKDYKTYKEGRKSGKIVL
tara:strand:- start:12955 stop:13770 length:816 start_codon:yes stop_codon:yes gene_type:complete